MGGTPSSGVGRPWVVCKAPQVHSDGNHPRDFWTGPHDFFKGCFFQSSREPAFSDFEIQNPPKMDTQMDSKLINKWYRQPPEKNIHQTNDKLLTF